MACSVGLQFYLFYRHLIYKCISTSLNNCILVCFVYLQLSLLLPSRKIGEIQNSKLSHAVVIAFRRVKVVWNVWLASGV